MQIESYAPLGVRNYTINLDIPSNTHRFLLSACISHCFLPSPAGCDCGCGCAGMGWDEIGWGFQKSHESAAIFNLCVECRTRAKNGAFAYGMYRLLAHPLASLMRFFPSLSPGIHKLGNPFRTRSGAKRLPLAGHWLF